MLSWGPLGTRAVTLAIDTGAGPEGLGRGVQKAARRGGRRVCAGAGTAPSCRHAWPPPCRHFPGQEAACPPRQGTRTATGTARLPRATRLSQRVRGMHRVLFPAGLQILGVLGLARWHPGLAGRAVMARLWLSHDPAGPWVPGLAPAAGGQCWDKRWAVPRKFVQAGERVTVAAACSGLPRERVRPQHTGPCPAHRCTW